MRTMVSTLLFTYLIAVGFSSSFVDIFNIKWYIFNKLYLPGLSGGPLIHHWINQRFFIMHENQALKFAIKVPLETSISYLKFLSFNYRIIMNQTGFMMVYKNLFHSWIIRVMFYSKIFSVAHLACCTVFMGIPILFPKVFKGDVRCFF